METTLRGVGVSHGVAVGEVRHMGTAVLEPPARQIPGGEAAREQRRARQALHAVAADLTARGVLAGGDAQAVLDAQALMARDPELLADVERRIAVGSTAERAVYDACAAYRDLLLGAGEYLAGRVADLEDVRNRIVARLLGVPMPGVPDSDEPYVLVARDLAPADTALLDTALVLGIVTEEGGPTSHSAILARALGVPAVVGVLGAADLLEGAVLAVDGSTGEVVVDPSEERQEGLRALAEQRKAELAAAQEPGRTSDGHLVPLLANLGAPADVQAAVEAGAEGVGLFRTRPRLPPRAVRSRRTGRCSPPSRAGGWWCASWTPVRTSRSASSPRRTSPIRPWACGGCARCWSTPRCCGPSCWR
jgi:phosphotransferase system enzyme I (PtsI)